MYKSEVYKNQSEREGDCIRIEFFWFESKLKVLKED